MGRDLLALRCRDPLADEFRRYGLGLKVLERPLDARNARIFQLDIQNSPAFGEYFRIYRGARANEIEILSGDASIRQLVLRVQEARRPYIQRVAKVWGRTREQVEEHARRAGGRIVRDSGSAWDIELWTSEQERRYLCGHDDLTHFVAQVPHGETVAEAHDSLRPRAVRESEARSPGSVLRQGEWFFLPLSDDERVKLAAVLREQAHLVKESRRLGQGGRPHVADFVARIEERRQGKRRSFVREHVFARGVVRHGGHRSLVLDGWHRVVRNCEVLEAASGLLRLHWID